jgi:uncharacterized protein (TIGR02266 family)
MTAKRSTRRVPIVAKIEAQAGGFPFLALAENIGEGGMLVRTASPLDEGAVVHLKFSLPGTGREIKVNATVRHVTPGESMGVKFEDMDDADSEAVKKYVETA